VLEIDTLRTEHRSCLPSHPVVLHSISLSFHFICLRCILNCGSLYRSYISCGSSIYITGGGLGVQWTAVFDLRHTVFTHPRTIVGTTQMVVFDLGSVEHAVCSVEVGRQA